MATGYAVASTREIKRALEEKLHFHGFSVTKGRGTGSRYWRVSWTNGPTVAMVDKVIAQFNDSKNDDSMTDLWIGSQYTNTSRSIEPEGAWRLLSTFDLMPNRYSTPDGLPALWELTQEAGRLACRQNAANGWGAGEDWLELVGIERPWEVNELLDGFRALGYTVSERTARQGKATRYGFCR